MREIIKRAVVTVLMAAIFATNGMSVLAEDMQKERKNIIQYGFISIPTDIKIKIIEGRSMVPLRECSKLLGATVTWDQDTKTASSELGDIKVAFTIGSNKYLVNDIEKEMDIAPFIDNGSTYIPLRYVAEGLGYKVDFKQTDAANIYIISEI